MKHVNMMDISLSQIIIFLSAAQYENFSMAAEQLNFTQPLISRTIASLENTLGLPLFYRERKGVVLTEAGQKLYDSWQHLLGEIERSIHAAQHIDSHRNNTLSIFDDRVSDNKLYLYPILAKFKKSYPAVIPMIEKTDAKHTLMCLYDGTADVAFLMRHEVADLNDSILAWQPLLEVPLGAYVHQSNPLYERDHLTLKDLKDEPLIFISAEGSSNYANNIISVFAQHGLEPLVHSYVTNNASLPLAIQQGDGIVLANELMEIIDMSEIKFMRLEETSGGLVVAWKRTPKNELVKSFVQIAVDYFQKEYRPNK